MHPPWFLSTVLALEPPTLLNAGTMFKNAADALLKCILHNEVQEGKAGMADKKYRGEKSSMPGGKLIGATTASTLRLIEDSGVERGGVSLCRCLVRQRDERCGSKKAARRFYDFRCERLNVWVSGRGARKTFGILPVAPSFCAAIPGAGRNRMACIPNLPTASPMQVPQGFSASAHVRASRLSER